MKTIKTFNYDEILDLKYTNKPYRYISPKLVDYISTNIEVSSIGNEVWNNINE